MINIKRIYEFLDDYEFDYLKSIIDNRVEYREYKYLIMNLMVDYYNFKTPLLSNLNLKDLIDKFFKEVFKSLNSKEGELVEFFDYDKKNFKLILYFDLDKTSGPEISDFLINKIFKVPYELFLADDKYLYNTKVDISNSKMGDDVVYTHRIEKSLPAHYFLHVKAYDAELFRFEFYFDYDDSI